MALSLRSWQDQAINKSLNWFSSENQSNNKFLINAAPGAGKTICAAVIAKKLIEKNAIKRVIVIAPRKEVVKQWKEEFKAVTGRSMLVVVGKNEDQGLDVCATWNSVDDQKDLFQTICETDDTLIICDEHHHAAVKAAWGESADSAFKKAKYVLILTGTPIRSDGETPVWFEYSGGELTHPKDGQYTLTYGEAVDLKFCRPAFFHRHEGKFTVVLKDEGDPIFVSGTSGIKIDDQKHTKKFIGAIQKSCDFYTLARSPKYKKDGKTPDLNSYQASMLEWGIAKLGDIKERLPNAGGLVIAPNIKVAEYMADILKELTGEKPMLVHSNLSNAEGLIEAFRESDKDWIVSVAMISEGVDIKRLRVLVYLPNAQTELSFRQALGRVVRSAGKDDDTSAYVVMPTHNIFEEYARRVEREMKLINVKDESKNTKVCPKCEEENDKKNIECKFCGYEFPQRKTRFKTCENDECKHENPVHLEKCQSCGEKFGHDFIITLDNALRMGGIAREMDVDEEDVQQAEKYYKNIRKEILASGDARVIEVLSLFPDEALVKLKRILNKAGE